MTVVSAAGQGGAIEERERLVGDPRGGVEKVEARDHLEAAGGDASVELDRIGAMRDGVSVGDDELHAAAGVHEQLLDGGAIARRRTLLPAVAPRGAP